MYALISGWPKRQCFFYVISNDIECFAVVVGCFARQEDMLSVIQTMKIVQPYGYNAIPQG